MGMCTCIRAAPVLRVRAANARARGRASGALDGAVARAPAIGVRVCDAVSSVLGAGSTTLITADVKTANV